MSETPAEHDEKTPLRFAIRRPVTTAMLFLTIAVFGWRSYQQLPLNLMPDISYPTLTVRTEFEGAAPEDVEKLVTRPLEEMLSIVGGLVEISSISSAGLSEIVLEFDWGTDMNISQQDVRDRLDLFEPPKEITQKPVILRYDPTLDPVMRIAVAVAQDPAKPLSREEESHALTTIRDAAQRNLKSDLEAEGGIAQVLVKGGREQEVQILVDAQRLKSLGLSLEYVVQSLAQQNINLSGGRLLEGKSEYLVRTLNEFTTVQEIADSLITTPGGSQLPLSSVAEVRMGTKERESIVRINGREAVELEIFKEGDANTVAVCNKVRDLLDFPRELGMAERLQAGFAKLMAEARKRAQGEDTNQPSLWLSKKRTLLDRLPANSQLSIISDQSRFIVGSIREVQSATVNGGVLALIVLFLFLRELKSTLIIGVSIPIALIATFVPMFAWGISLNIMSLGGLALGVGMLVDNSIVVLESIFRCKEEGDSTVMAADRGTREVGGAVVASTLTTVAVFFPIAFVEGIAGQLFGDLGMTVTFSLLASLLTALYLNPLLASRETLAIRASREVVWVLRAYRAGRDAGEGFFASLAAIPGRAAGYLREGIAAVYADTLAPGIDAIRGIGGGGAAAAKGLGALVLLPLEIGLFVIALVLRGLGVVLSTVLFVIAASVFGVILLAGKLFRAVLWLPLEAFNRAFESFRSVYAWTLYRILPYAPIVLVLVALLTLHAVNTARGLGTELIPAMKQGEFGIRLELRAGTRLEDTAAQAERIEALVRAMPEVDSVSVQVGEENARAESSRGENVAEFTVLLKNPDQMALVQDEIIERLRGRILSSVGPDQEVTFTLPSMFSFKTAVELQIVGDDLGILRDIGKRALAVVREIPGVEDAELSVKPGYPEVLIELDRELLAARGLSPGQVALKLRREVQGEVATKFSRGGDKVDIRVRTKQDLLRSVEDLKQVAVNDGQPPIPLMDVARVRVQEGPSEIRRIDQRQVVLIQANVSGRDLGSVSNEIMARVERIERPNDYYFLPGGQFRELETSYSSLYIASLLALFLVYVVMACQFESIWHPAIVMFSVPLAFVGVIYALAWSGVVISVMVFLGGIVLAGIVVNNAIVLVDYVNLLRGRGMPVREALVHAGRVRLRPIFMTTITTVLGLLPMVLATGEGAELRRPLAITVMSGLCSSTLLTLVVIPMIYYIFNRDRRKVAA